MIDKNLAVCANCTKYVVDKDYKTIGSCPEKKGVRLENDYPCRNFQYKYHHEKQDRRK